MITTDSLVFQIDDINQLYTVIENRKIQASKIADKMKWIAIRPEVFEEKNNIIRNELNRYLEEIDNSYKNNRGRILQQQIDELKGIIIQKITGYKGIDENLIRRITNVAETQIPPSMLKALKMDEYINKQKAIFIFSTNNKKNYKADVEQMFANTTKVQFDAYINEIMDVARDKTAELIQEFKNNIDSISSSLELLIRDEKKASEEQLKAKTVLDMVAKMDDELNKKIWGEEEIKQAEDVILGKKDEDWYFMWVLGKKKKGFLFAALLICPFGQWYAWNVIYNSYYVPHIVISLVSVAMFIRLLKTEKKSLRIVLIVLSVLLALVAGLGGVRQLMVCYILSWMSVVILFFTDSGNRVPVPGFKKTVLLKDKEIKADSDDSETDETGEEEKNVESGESTEEDKIKAKKPIYDSRFYMTIVASAILFRKFHWISD